MTDYSEWTETEISSDEYYSEAGKRYETGVHYRYQATLTHEATAAYRYYRLDPPAPKYREGEMRWLTNHEGGDFRSLVVRQRGRWNVVGDDAFYPDEYVDEPNITLSDPVVVVPAPTNEEREDFIRVYWQDEPGSVARWQYAKRIANALRDQEATDD